MLEPDGDHDDELDAFNDDTFGVGAAEWAEDDHEALAAMTEEEKKAMDDANDFFDLGGEDGDDGALEELEPLEGNGNGAASKDELRLQKEFEEMQLMERAKREQQQQAAQVQAAQVQAAQVQAHAAMSGLQQQQQQPDPAIMSVDGKLPQPGMAVPPSHYVITQSGGPPPMQPLLPPNMIPQQQPHFQQQPQPGMMPRPMGQPKTLEELEREMMMAPPPMQQQPQPRPPPPQHQPLPPQQQMHQQHVHHQHNHHHEQHQQHMHQQQHQHHQHQHHQHPQHMHHQHMHHQQMQMQQQYGMPPQQQQQFRRPPNHQHHHMQQQQYGMQQQPGSPHHQRGYNQNQGYNNHHQGGRNNNFNNNNRNTFDDKNRETFGDDLVDEQHREHRRERETHRQDQQRQRHGGSDDPARRDLMPGHVHALGILRDARERESTGNPNLDLELEKRDAEEAELRASYLARNRDDDFADLMTPRERQWIINIQLQQLKCENPFIDDYYFTVFNQNRELAAERAEKEAELEKQLEDTTYQPKRMEEGPQLLLQAESTDSPNKDAKYKPEQFSNSLGKLQAVSVKAPRKIIDIGIVINEAADGQSAETKSSRHFKSTLMELERLYTTLIDVEDCDKKLAALPTGTAMHDQVQGERATALKAFCVSLTAEGRIRRYLLVRKGKVLLKRCLSVVGDAEVQLFAGTLFAILPLAIKRDKEDLLIPRFWDDLLQHISTCNVDLLAQYMRLLNTGASSSSSCSFKFCLSNPFAMSVLLLVLKTLLPMHAALSTEGTVEATTLMEELANAVAEVGDLSEPMFELGDVKSGKSSAGSALEDRKEIGRLLILSKMKKEKSVKS